MTDQCVGSGMCCRMGPCGFSAAKMEKEGRTWDPNVGCPYLVLVGIQWRCGIFLTASPELKQEMTDAMGIGFGCGSTIGNSARDALIRRLRSESSSRSPVTSSETWSPETFSPSASFGLSGTLDSLTKK